jgi:hypothetical protein
MKEIKYLGIDSPNSIEEIDVEIKQTNKVAELSFYFPHKPEWNQIVHTYFSEMGLLRSFVPLAFRPVLLRARRLFCFYQSQSASQLYQIWAEGLSMEPNQFHRH